MADTDALIYGIIHIGSSNLSMRIVEYKNINDIRIIEEVRKETSFGEEVFLNKKLSFSSIRRLCDMLNGLRQLLNDYRVKDYKVYATAVLREAENWRPILDLIRVNTGFLVDVVDMPQEIYYKHFLLQHHMKQLILEKKYDPADSFLFIDITSGCVGMTVWKNGALQYQHNAHIGTLRLLETFKANQRDSRDFPFAMAEYLHTILKPLWMEIHHYNPSNVILSGREARIVASLMNFKMDEAGRIEIHKDSFQKLYEVAGFLSPSRIRQKYKISEAWAMTVLPTIHIYKEILDNVFPEHIVLFGTTFVEAVATFYGAVRTKDTALAYMRKQNIELTRAIAKSYYYEPMHAEALEEYSHAIISGLGKKSGLTERDEVLLRMAIILYQVGKYVNLLNSQEHAWNIIRGTDIFGISDKEKDIVACIVYYDHKRVPGDEEEPFRVLSDLAKIVALKLIAVFRLARAMDISRCQKMTDVNARVSGASFLIEYDSKESTALETWIFEKGKELFENVYGLEVKLERR